jgi:N-methylhydantoinase A
MKSVEEGGPDPDDALRERRRAFVPEREEFAEIPVYDGHRLRSGNRIAGPALIERVDTTIFVTETYHARIDGLGSTVVERSAPPGRERP